MTSANQQRLMDLEKQIESLQEENQYLKQILAHMPGHICWKNREGVYLGCNDKVAILAKVSTPKDFIGMTLYDFCDKVICP